MQGRHGAAQETGRVVEREYPLPPQLDRRAGRVFHYQPDWMCQPRCIAVWPPPTSSRVPMQGPYADSEKSAAGVKRHGETLEWPRPCWRREKTSGRSWVIGSSGPWMRSSMDRKSVTRRGGGIVRWLDRRTNFQRASGHLLPLPAIPPVADRNLARRSRCYWASETSRKNCGVANCVTPRDAGA